MATATDLFKLMKSFIKDMDEAYPNPCADHKIEKLMTKDVVTITEETSLFEIMENHVRKEHSYAAGDGHVQ